ncbi:hypothetical protein KQI77_08040 [Clostridium sp. MSJ-8]|uniref:hypothetical protein n=1 Tax=Clostridium sp. MSJ-8 TaxID=2841510 RepID=UPI001C0F23E5|nr:hypothetical protein [Clostridium sp. MSJ-8]MBU5488107.1 hypothetical protein [Clostridium sp. MSJ-8]
MKMAYYIFLLLIFFLCLNIINKNRKYSPKKIKTYMYIATIILIFRYICLLILCIAKSFEYLTMIKWFIYSSYLAIPLITLAFMYIFLRFDNKEFKYIYFIGALITFIYIINIIFVDIIVSYNSQFGYVIDIGKSLIFIMEYFLIIGAMLLYIIYYIDKPNCNKKGVLSIIIYLSVCIIDNIILISGIPYFPTTIISDYIFVTFINFFINVFIKK